MPAITLETAYNELDFNLPVTPGQIPTLFVERRMSPTQEIKADLTISRSPIKLLFVGHRGSGKSSELNYLTSLIEDKFLCIPVPLYDIFKTPAVSHIEVVFAMTLRLLAAASSEEILPTGLVNDVWTALFEDSFLFFKRALFGETIIPADNQQTFTLKVNVLAAELETKIGTESYTRDQVKEKFAGRVSEMLEKLDNVARKLEKDTGKRLLLIVEDLDKFDLQDTRNLFLEHARTLTAPYPNIIYSFPVAMRYSNDFPEIRKGFREAYLLPNVALKHRDDSPDENGVGTMRKILLNRISPQLIEPEAIERIIQLCGGHIKSMIQLAQRATLKTIVSNRAMIGMEQVNAAAAALRDDYASLLTDEQLDLLRQQHADRAKRLEGVSPARQELLYNGSLYEYKNTVGPWGDVNPIVLELLERNL